MMRRRVIGVISGLMLCSSAQAQERPDFSGRWVTDPPAVVPSARDAAAGRPMPRSPDLGSGWGRNISIAQDTLSLTVEWPFYSSYDMQPPLRFVYSLDGAESVNTIMLGRGMQRQRSRVAWMGRSLVITTAHSFTDPASGRPVMSEVRQTLTLESPTSLIVETARAGVLGGPSSTTRNVYVKGGTP
jgi:hypothetical protein